MKIAILGLSITSSWGNGHATTYRALVKELARRGHQILFLERDLPWYAENRDAPNLSAAEVEIYPSLAALKCRYGAAVAAADAVIVGSYVPEGIAVGEWVLRTAGGLVAFYDIDTPVTLSALGRDHCDYICREMVPQYGLYLSFTGGPTLRILEEEFGSPRARPLYCSVDPLLYFSERQDTAWELGYLGTYSADRQPALERLLLGPARQGGGRKFVVAGAQYPTGTAWPPNVQRIQHLAPAEHRRFFNRQRFTLNLTRANMIAAGYSPSVRLFEAAACGVPIISDWWVGLEEFFQPDREVLIAQDGADVNRFLRDLSETEACAIGAAAQKKVLAGHTAAHRAAELEKYLSEACAGSPPDSSPGREPGANVRSTAGVPA